MRLTIIGASGQGKVAADMARICGYDEIEFLDDNGDLCFCGSWPVVGGTEKAEEINNDLFIAIGDSGLRKKMMDRFQNKNIVTLIHPNAVVADDVEIGEGSIVMAGAVINPGCRIGKGAIINTCSSIDHDCSIGCFVHVSVGCHVCGTVSVGDNVWVGAGTIIINNKSVCEDCIIGAGTLVIKDINLPGTYVGHPARRIK